METWIAVIVSVLLVGSHAQYFPFKVKLHSFIAIYSYKV